MKIKFGLSQFSAGNTPVLAQKIGDYALLIAGIGVTIMTIPTAMAEAGIQDFVMPAILLKAAKICAVIGVIGKLLSKFIGAIDFSGNPISTEQQKEDKKQG